MKALLFVRRTAVTAAMALGLTAASANAASLIGQEILIRFDLSGADDFETVTVGDGPEITNLASPLGRPWTWTVDFGANDFLIRATLTQATVEFFPDISFRSIKSGILPADISAFTFTTRAFSPALANSSFGESGNAVVGTIAGVRFSASGDNEFPDPVNAGTTMTWAGTIALPETAVVPLPAAAWFLGAGLFGLVMVGRRR